MKAAIAYGFQTLGLKRIEATAFTHNPASQRVLERSGLSREGTLKGWHCKDGKLIDAVMFAIVAAERGLIVLPHGPPLLPPARRGFSSRSDADSPARRRCAPRAAVNAPSVLNVITFEYYNDGQNRKVIVTTSPALQRIDEPDDRWSFFYDPATQIYTGLEHGNFTYWTFSWSEVRGSLETSKRGEKRLQDMSLDGINNDNLSPSTNAPSLPTCLARHRRRHRLRLETNRGQEAHRQP